LPATNWRITQADLSIGNRWQWDSGFTLGVAWAGYSRVIKKKSENLTGAGLSSETKAKEDNDFQDDIARPSLHFLKLSLGISF
jgi:hypothetical protein